VKLDPENEGIKNLLKRPEFTYTTTERVTLRDSKFLRNCCENLKYNKFQTAFEEKWHITEGTTLLHKKGRISRACVVSGCQAVRNVTKRSRKCTVNCSSLFANATNVFFLYERQRQVRGQTEFQTVSKISTPQSWQLFLQSQFLKTGE
jgi:hypothetical protein